MKMKTRIQKAGGEFGSKTGIVWNGDLPFIPVASAGLRIVVTDEKDESLPYKVSQIALEINANGDHEQVVYVNGPGKPEHPLFG